MELKPEIFKTYDIRGKYPNEINEKSAYMIGYFFAKKKEIKYIKIAHDFRNSYQSLTKFLIQGIIDAGKKIIYLGLSSTPNFYYSLFKNTNTGIMVTASHNPKEFNGFKILLNGKSFDMKTGLLELKNEIFEKHLDIEKNFQIQKTKIENINLRNFLLDKEIKEFSTLDKYVSYLSKLYNKILNEKEKEIIKNLKIGEDFSNGVSCLAGTLFAEQNNLNSNQLNKTLNGNFPNHSPDPLKAIQYIKKHVHKDVYFTCCFDGDGDRLIIYDKNGDLILPDYIILMIIDYFSKQGETKFATDLRVSKKIIEFGKEKKLDIKLIRVGRAFYQEYMKKNNCIFGAELSGHIFFREFNFLDNPDIALIFLLKIIAMHLLSNNKFEFLDIIEKYKKYFKFQEMNFIVKSPTKSLLKIKEEFKEFLKMELDGFSFDVETFWFNVRKSNTENLIRLNLEGLNEEITKKGLNKIKKSLV